MKTISLHFDNAREAQDLGLHDPHLMADIGHALEVELTVRGLSVQATGKATACDRFRQFFDLLRSGRDEGAPLSPNRMSEALQAFVERREKDLLSLYQCRLEVGLGKTPIFPSTLGQLSYIEAIRHHDMTFGLGPAGTGKTYLAMAMAVHALQKGDVSRIILTRPVREAGEALGFLPGDLNQKILPYMRPLYDALYDMMRPEDIEKCLERGTIEAAPLAYMRGRTLNHAFVILDEAQNTTAEQMLMFLTRLGFDSKAVLTGDLSQIDLPGTKESGLAQARARLRHVKGISVIELRDRDVVRHPLVQDIIKAYREASS